VDGGRESDTTYSFNVIDLGPVEISDRGWCTVADESREVCSAIAEEEGKKVDREKLVYITLSLVEMDSE